MKRFLILLAISSALVSCGGGAAMLKNSATYSRGAASLVVTPMQADLQLVGNKKITYSMGVDETVRAGGIDNVIATAVKQALDANGGDVLLGLETVEKYNDDGVIESVIISGFPAKYTNFRPAKDIPAVAANKDEGKGGGLPLFGKKK